MANGKGTALLTATALTESGTFQISGALTPYDVENLYDQFATLRRPGSGDVCVDVELGGVPANSPELRAFTRRLKRLQRSGVTVRLHAARGRKRGPLLAR